MQPLSPGEAACIKNVGEKIFAVAATAIPHLLVYWEPCTFEGVNSKKTIPDFYVLNTRNPKTKGVFVEVTQSLELDDSNSKSRQRRVMKIVSLVDQDIRYLQFNGRVLANIQESLVRDDPEFECHEVIQKKRNMAIVTEKIGGKKRKRNATIEG